jgi:hypothetical protein
VLTRAASGDGEVVADNSGTISSMLADYNDTIPTPAGRGESGGFCTVGSAGGAGSLSSEWLGVVLGAVGLRSRRGSKGGRQRRRSTGSSRPSPSVGG